MQFRPEVLIGWVKLIVFIPGGTEVKITSQDNMRFGG
jgi:hypothetical protein